MIQESGRFICQGRNILLVPFNVWAIQTLTHSKGGASIRQTERRYVPPLLGLHLWWVFHFRVVIGNVLNAAPEVVTIIVMAVGYPKSIPNGLKFITMVFDDALVAAVIPIIVAASNHSPKHSQGSQEQDY